MNIGPIGRAISFARREARLVRLKELAAPGVILENEQRMFAIAAADIAGDAEVESFLPFARKVVVVEEARYDTVTASFLGRFVDWLESYAADCNLLNHVPKTDEREPTIRKDFEDGRVGFIRAVEEGDIAATLRHLHTILHHAEMEVKYFELRNSLFPLTPHARKNPPTLSREHIPHIDKAKSVNTNSSQRSMYAKTA